MQIKCHTLKWVKSHCYFYQGNYDSCGCFTHPTKPMALWKGNMTKELCGNTFTVISKHCNSYKVKGSNFYVPKWLVYREK